MGISIWQIMIVLFLILILFGRGKISSLMGDIAKGITSFKKGMKEGAEESADASEAARPISKQESAKAASSEKVVEGEKVNK